MKQVLVINTDLYPDKENVKAALETLKADADIKWIDLPPSQTSEAFWDSLVEDLLAADRIISI
jgi:hypothetical protein